MAKQNRTTLKGYFETGDIPTGGNYVDLIDSPLILDTENTGSINILGTITASGDISASGDVYGVNADFVGTGSFDKGIFFNVPIYGNFINYSWRPLTKDPGAKIIRKNSLHDLLVKFQPIN